MGLKKKQVYWMKVPVVFSLPVSVAGGGGGGGGGGFFIVPHTLEMFWPACLL